MIFFDAIYALYRASFGSRLHGDNRNLNVIKDLAEPSAISSACSYQTKFKSDDWNDSEIIKPRQTQSNSGEVPRTATFAGSLDNRANSPSSANLATSSTISSEDDPQVVLNAGTRLWKLGLTEQAIQLFEYTLKNAPVYRGIAAYNLGAIAEHNGDLKLAAQYYQWALKQRTAIQVAANAHPEMAAEVVKTRLTSLTLLKRNSAQFFLLPIPACLI